MTERERGVEAVQPGESLHSVMADYQRQVIAATIEAHPTMASAARAMGMTREGLYRLRKRLGFHIESQEKPVPDDWRERLEA